jgi:methylmalonyl-CoA/ethylmalonyl-CoA epimerase
MPEAAGPRLHHLGVAVPAIEAALSTYRDLFGYALVSGPFHDPLQKVSVCFVGSGRPGDVLIELVEPADGQSPVNKTLAKGIGAYHVCYEVEDLEGALAGARARGCVIVSQPVPAVAFGGRRIAWIYTPTRQLVEYVER